jgi:hypothetical protein
MIFETDACTFAQELHHDIVERLQDGDEGFDGFPVSICKKLIMVSFTKILDLKNDDSFFQQVELLQQEVEAAPASLHIQNEFQGFILTGSQPGQDLALYELLFCLGATSSKANNCENFSHTSVQAGIDLSFKKFIFVKA